MKKKIIVMIILLCGIITKVEAKKVKEYFNDDNFFNCIATTNSITENTEETDFNFQTIETINCKNKQIQNTTGLEKFTGLKTLVLDDNNIKNIDLSKNILLETLSISNNTSLNAIDLSKNTKLKRLDALNSNITQIDLSKNTLLEDLSLGGNKLKNIDLSNNQNLKIIEISDNQLEKIKVNKNAQLEFFDIHNNNFLKNITTGISNEIKIEEYISLPSKYTIDYIIEDQTIAQYNKDNKTIKPLKAGTTLASLKIDNMNDTTSTGTPEELTTASYQSNLTIVNDKNEESQETKKEEPTNPETGVGISILIITIATPIVILLYALFKDKDFFKKI